MGWVIVKQQVGMGSLPCKTSKHHVAPLGRYSFDIGQDMAQTSIVLDLVVSVAKSRNQIDANLG